MPAVPAITAQSVKAENRTWPIQRAAQECAVRFLCEQQHWNEAIGMVSPDDYDCTPEMVECIALCFYMTGRCPRALEVLNLGFRRGWRLPSLLVLKGKCLLKLGEYERAQAAFRDADDMLSTDESRLGLMRCEARLCENPIVLAVSGPDEAVRWDWYDGPTTVVVVIYVPGLREEDVRTQFHERRCEIEIAKRVWRFTLDRDIDPAGSTTLVTAQKVEAKMKKLDVQAKCIVMEEGAGLARKGS